MHGLAVAQPSGRPVASLRSGRGGAPAGCASGGRGGNADEGASIRLSLGRKLLQYAVIGRGVNAALRRRPESIVRINPDPAHRPACDPASCRDARPRWRGGIAACAVLVVAATAAGCASRGPQSPDARPVLYPNAAFERMGKAQADREVDQCIDRAIAAGATPTHDAAGRAVAGSAVRGATVAGVAGAVGAAVGGGDVGRAAGIGIAAGGSAGAVRGLFASRDTVNPTYRNFVARCLTDRGLEVIGWN